MAAGEMQHGRIVGGEFVADGPVVAIRGKEGCTDLTCTRMGIFNPETGLVDSGKCIGWHCASCGEPADAQGMCRNRCAGPKGERA